MDNSGSSESITLQKCTRKKDRWSKFVPVDYKKNFGFRSYLIDQCNRKNLVKTHGFYWANYRIWIMNYFCSKPSTSVKANVFLDVLEKKSRQNWTWWIFSNHIIARLPNNFGLFIIGIQSSFCHNTFSPMTCYLMTEKREKEIVK